MWIDGHNKSHWASKECFAIMLCILYVVCFCSVVYIVCCVLCLLVGSVLCMLCMLYVVHEALLQQEDMKKREECDRKGRMQ